MTKNLLLLILIHFSIFSFGQVSFGIKVGINVNDVAIKGKPDDIEFSPENSVGFHVGLYGVMKLAEKLSFIPEFQFSKRGYSDFGYRFNLNYLELPMLFSYSPIKWLNIDIGPDFGYKISAVIKDGSFRNKIDFMYNRNFDFGLNGGLRFNIAEKVSVLARYYYGLTFINDLQLRDENNNSNGEMLEYNRNVQLGLSYKIK